MVASDVGGHSCFGPYFGPYLFQDRCGPCWTLRDRSGPVARYLLPLWTPSLAVSGYRGILWNRSRRRRRKERFMRARWEEPWSRLLAFREHLPQQYEIPERLVRTYHDLVSELGPATG